MDGTTRNEKQGAPQPSDPDGRYSIPDVKDDEVVIKAGGEMVPVSKGTAGPALSRVPQVRMAASDDELLRMFRAIEDAEAGRQSPDEVVLEPGGAMVPVNKGTAGPALSQVPKVRMAAVDQTSLAEWERLDPRGVEKWHWVDDKVLPGWVFEMAPLKRPFTFLAFRVPTYSGRWLLTSILPEFDDLPGHRTHVVNALIGGGKKVPVICKAQSDISCGSISESRGLAAYFAFYHTWLDVHGKPPFSS
jgi:hypothetical protein